MTATVRSVLLVLVVLAAGFGVAALFLPSPAAEPTPAPAPVSAPAAPAAPAPTFVGNDAPPTMGASVPAETATGNDSPTWTPGAALEAERRLTELAEMGPGDPMFDCLADGNLWEDCPQP